MNKINSKLKKININNIKIIKGFINNIINRYKVNINFHDVIGLSVITPDLEKIFRPYTFHNNSFCNYIKKNPETFKKCFMNIKKVGKVCENRKNPFYGSCYMGIEEIVFPINDNDNLYGFFCIGQFSQNINKSLKKLEIKCNKYKLDFNSCQENYLKTVKNIKFSLTDLSYDLGVLSQYVISLYKNIVLEKGVKDFNTENTSDFIIKNTVSFIGNNYQRDISLKILAANSYCNPSYLSHIFKEKMDITVSDYINQVRIERSKELLKITNLSITDIALSVGYNNLNYFSRVFKKYTGISPSDYRK